MSDKNQSDEDTESSEEDDITEIYSRLTADARDDRLGALRAVERALADNPEQSETAVERIEPLLSDSSDLVRARAVACLEKTAEQKPDAVCPVAETIRELYDDSVRVQRRVAHALGYVCVDDPTEVARHMDYLQKAIVDEDSTVRDNAKESLEQIATTEVAKTIDTPLTETQESVPRRVNRTAVEVRVLCVSIDDEDESRRLRERSVEALAARASEKPSQVRKGINAEICSTALTSDIPALRVHMSATLRHLAEDSVYYFLDSTVDRENEEENGPSPFIIDTAEDRLTDPDERVRKHLLELFGAIAADRDSVEMVERRFDQIQARLDDDSIAVRTAAVAVARRLAPVTPSTVNTSKSRLRDRLSDPNTAVREQTGATLTALALHVGDATAVQEVVTEAQEDPAVAEGVATAFATVIASQPDLGRVGIPPILPLLEVDADRIREDVVRGLARTAAEPTSLPEPALSTLQSRVRNRLSDPNTAIREQTGATLTAVALHSEDATAVREVVTEAQEDPAVAKGVASTYATMTDDQPGLGQVGIPAILPLLEADTDPICEAVARGWHRQRPGLRHCPTQQSRHSNRDYLLKSNR
jgi:hypothetical protein